MKRIYAENRIRELRKARGMTQGDKATIAKLETRAMALSADYIKAIARVFNVRPGDVIEASNSRMSEIPLLGSVSAGTWREAVENADETITVPDALIGKNLFALTISGDSMDMVVPDGGIIVVNPDDIELTKNRIYVVSNGEHETTFKRFDSSPPRLLPCSTNPTHTPIIIGREPFVAIGRAVYAMSRL